MLQQPDISTSEVHTSDVEPDVSTTVDLASLAMLVVGLEHGKIVWRHYQGLAV